MQKNNKSKHIGLAVFLGVMLYVYIALTMIFISGRKSLQDIQALLSSSEYWITSFLVYMDVVFGGMLLTGIFKLTKMLVGNDKPVEFGWTSDNLKSKKEFVVEDWNTITPEQSGVIIGAERTRSLEELKNKKLSGIETVAVAKQNVLLFGRECGEEEGMFLERNFEKWGQAKVKPNVFFFGDPAVFYPKPLEKHGLYDYDIVRLDFVNPKHSVKWNPFMPLMDYVIQIKDLENELESLNGKYHGAGETFQTYKDVRDRLDALKNKLVWCIQNILDALCPKRDGTAADEDARSIMQAIILSFCEDYVAGTVGQEQIRLNMLVKYIHIALSDMEALKKYLVLERTKHSMSKAMVKDIFVDPKQLKATVEYLAGYGMYFNYPDTIESASGDEYHEGLKTEKAKFYCIILSDEWDLHKNLALLFMQQHCFNEQGEKTNNRYIVTQNVPMSLYQPILQAIKNKQGGTFFWLMNNFLSLVAHYGPTTITDFQTEFTVKLCFNDVWERNYTQYCEFCADNTHIVDKKTMKTEPVINMETVRVAHEKKDVLISIKGYPPIFTKFTSTEDNKEQPTSLMLDLTATVEEPETEEPLT